MRLTLYGIREWLIGTVLCAILAGALLWLGAWGGVGIVLLLWLAVLAFFRDPIRRIPTDLADGVMLCPADGIITAVVNVHEHDAVDGPATIIRIFLTVLHVHVNRSPCDGEVVALRHTPGSFHHAQSAQAVLANESNLITMRIGTGETIGVRQVAGRIARRIVCPLTIGARLTRGEKFGMIKFGSTTELILPRPDDVTVHIKVGQQVRAGLTVVATLAPIPMPAPEVAEVLSGTVVV